MRESALFGTMFGLGAGAVLVGVTVSRLVVGQPSDKPAEEPLAVATETAPALAAETARPAQVQPPPAVVSSAVEPPKVARPRETHAPRKHLRPSVVEAPPLTTAPIVQEAPPMVPAIQESPPTTASVANREALAAAPPAPEVRDAPVTSQPPVAVVRGGAARPGSRAPGARVIQVEPQDGSR